MKKLFFFLGVASFLLLVTKATQAQPANDLFANAWILTGTSATTNGNNNQPAFATREDGEPWPVGVNIGGRSVWFRWTAPVGGPTRVSTLGSSFNTILGVYTGTAVNALTFVAANDNFGGTAQSQVDFQAT